MGDNNTLTLSSFIGSGIRSSLIWLTIGPSVPGITTTSPLRSLPFTNITSTVVPGQVSIIDWSFIRGRKVNSQQYTMWPLGQYSAVYHVTFRSIASSIPCDLQVNIQQYIMWPLGQYSAVYHVTFRSIVSSNHVTFRSIVSSIPCDL